MEALGLSFVAVTRHFPVKKEIAEINLVNRRSTYKLFKLGLATVFVISRLHCNRSELKVPAVLRMIHLD